MGHIRDNGGTVTYVDKDLTVDADSTFTGAGTNTLSGTTTLSGGTTISGALTQSGTIAFSAQVTKRAPVAKTAAYQVLPADSGVTFTNRGDTDAITFTLPTTPTAGLWYRFYGVEDFAVAVAGATDGIVSFNSASLTSIKWGTSGEIIGNGFEAEGDGTSWLITVLSATPAGNAPTLA